MLQFNYTVSRYSTTNAEHAYRILQFNYTVNRFSTTNAEPAYIILQFNYRTRSVDIAPPMLNLYIISGVSYTVNLRIAFVI